MLKESLQALLSKTRVEIGGPFDMVLRALGLESDSQPAGTHKKMWEADALPLTRKAAEELHRHAINHGLRPSVLGRLGLPMEKLLRSERAVSIARGALRMARGVDSGSFASLDPAQVCDLQVKAGIHSLSVPLSDFPFQPPHVRISPPDCCILRYILLNRVQISRARHHTSRLMGRSPLWWLRWASSAPRWCSTSRS